MVYAIEHICTYMCIYKYIILLINIWTHGILINNLGVKDSQLNIFVFQKKKNSII